MNLRAKYFLDALQKRLQTRRIDHFGQAALLRAGATSGKKTMRLLSALRPCGAALFAMLALGCSSSPEPDSVPSPPSKILFVGNSFIYGDPAGVPIRELLLVLLTAAVVTFLSTGAVRIAAIRFGDEGQGWCMMPVADYLTHPRAIPHFCRWITAMRR